MSRLIGGMVEKSKRIGEALFVMTSIDFLSQSSVGELVQSLYLTYKTTLMPISLPGTPAHFSYLKGSSLESFAKYLMAEGRFPKLVADSVRCQSVSVTCTPLGCHSGVCTVLVSLSRYCGAGSDALPALAVGVRFCGSFGDIKDSLDRYALPEGILCSNSSLAAVSHLWRHHGYTEMVTDRFQKTVLSKEFVASMLDQIAEVVNAM